MTFFPNAGRGRAPLSVPIHGFGRKPRPGGFSNLKIADCWPYRKPCGLWRVGQFFGIRGTGSRVLIIEILIYCLTVGFAAFSVSEALGIRTGVSASTVSKPAQRRKKFTW